MAPLVILAVFLGLQVAHLGLGLAVVQYATASAARSAVRADSPSVVSARFKELTDLVGLENQRAETRLVSAGSGGPRVTSNLEAFGCAEVPVYPLVGPLVKEAFRARGGDACTGPRVGYKEGRPAKFIIRARTTVRMNYQKGG